VLGACNYIRTTCADVRAPRTLVVHLRQEEINFRMLALVKRNRGTSSKMISVLKNKSNLNFFNLVRKNGIKYTWIRNDITKGCFKPPLLPIYLKQIVEKIGKNKIIGCCINN
jgi:hypothetical protein